MRKLLAFAALALAACGEPTSAGQAALEKYVGKNFSELKVQTLDGAPAPLRPLLALGKPVVLNVWATWCAPCVEELPSLNALALDGKYTVVTIATDKDAADVQKFLNERKLGAASGSAMVTLWDPLGMVTTGEVGSRALPASYVLDVSGTVKLVEAGARAWDNPRMIAKMKKNTP